MTLQKGNEYLQLLFVKKLREQKTFQFQLFEGFQSVKKYEKEKPEISANKMTPIFSWIAGISFL